MSRPTPLTFLRRGLHQIREHGAMMLVDRYWHRRRILGTAPTPCDPSAQLEVHVQVCRRDWLNAVWTLKSFRHYAGQPFRLVLLDDGSLSDEERGRLRRHFPGVVYPARDAIRREVQARLAPLAPGIAALHGNREYITLPKIVDSWLFAANARVLMLDPDVLFFAPPSELLAFSARGLGREIAAFNHRPHVTHNDGQLSVEGRQLVERLGLTLPGAFMLGLGVVDWSRMDWPYLDAAIAKLSLRPGWGFMIDQTLMGIMCARDGWHRLAIERYAVDPGPSLAGVVARHYFAKTRDLMYCEGMRTLRRRGLLREWRRPA